MNVEELLLERAQSAESAIRILTEEVKRDIERRDWKSAEERIGSIRLIEYSQHVLVSFSTEVDTGADK